MREHRSGGAHASAARWLRHKEDAAVAAIFTWKHQRALRPMHAILLAGTVPLFLGAMLSDIAYASSYQVQWTNFASCQIGKAHGCTPVTNAHLVCRLLLEKKRTVGSADAGLDDMSYDVVAVHVALSQHVALGRSYV